MILPENIRGNDERTFCVAEKLVTSEVILSEKMLVNVKFSTISTVEHF